MSTHMARRHQTRPGYFDIYSHPSNNNLPCTVKSEELSCAMTNGVKCLAFKPDNEMEYLVGTEEGDIHLCSTEYASEYLR